MLWVPIVRLVIYIYIVCVYFFPPFYLLLFSGKGWMSHSWAWSALLRDLFVSNSLCHGGESQRAALTGSLSCRGNLSLDAALLSGDCWPWWGEKNGRKQARERERWSRTGRFLDKALHGQCRRYKRKDNILFWNYDWMPGESSNITIIYVWI